MSFKVQKHTRMNDLASGKSHKADRLKEARRISRAGSDVARKSSHEINLLRIGVFQEANQYMPFSKATTPDWCIRDYRPIDSLEAKSVFFAFDNDGSGDLDFNELKAVLVACGVSPDAGKVNEIAKTIFYVTGEEKITWDVFRLWLRRAGFCDRALNWQEKIYYTLDDTSSSKVAFYIGMTVVTFIILSVLSFLFETLPSFNEKPCPGCEPEINLKSVQSMEVMVVLIFTLEYVTRLFCYPFVHQFIDASNFAVEKYMKFDNSESDLWNIITEKNTVSKAYKVYEFVCKPINIVDFLAILPFYIELVLTTGDGSALVVLRILRLSRLFRVLKLRKYASGFEVFITTISESVAALSVLSFILLLLVIFFGALIFLFERGSWYKPTDECRVHDAVTDISYNTPCADAGFPHGAYLRPHISGLFFERSPFESTFDAMWCVIVTMTTCGYGDMYPTTMTGRLIMVPCMIGGIMSLALPINVLGSNFAIAYDIKQKQLLQEKEDVFDATKIGLQVYAAGLPRDAVQHEQVKRELVNIEKARNMLHASYLQSEVSIAVRRLQKDLHSLRDDIHEVFLGQDRILSYLHIDRKKQPVDHQLTEEFNPEKIKAIMTPNAYVPAPAPVLASALAPAAAPAPVSESPPTPAAVLSGAIPLTQAPGEPQKYNSSVVPETAKFFI